MKKILSISFFLSLIALTFGYAILNLTEIKPYKLDEDTAYKLLYKRIEKLKNILASNESFTIQDFNDIFSTGSFNADNSFEKKMREIYKIPNTSNVSFLGELLKNKKDEIVEYLNPDKMYIVFPFGKQNFSHCYGILMVNRNNQYILFRIKGITGRIIIDKSDINNENFLDFLGISRKGTILDKSVKEKIINKMLKK